MAIPNGHSKNSHFAIFVIVTVIVICHLPLSFVIVIVTIIGPFLEPFVINSIAINSIVINSIVINSIVGPFSEPFGSIQLFELLF